MPTADVAKQRGYELLRLLRAQFTERGDWDNFMKTAFEHGLVTKDVAFSGPPCTISVRRVGGQLCTRLITDLTVHDMSVDDLKRIVDPLNWAKVDSIFCEMTELTPALDAHGWSRVLEDVSTDPSNYLLTTALKYWKEDMNGGGAAINYDLDDARGDTADCGLVLLDRGYIWLTPTPNGGCRIRNSKEVLIEGISATASAMFATAAGWVDSQVLAFATATRLPVADIVPWRPSHCSGAPLRAGPAFPYRTSPPRFPDGSRKLLISRAVESITGFVDEIAGPTR